MTTVNIHEAKTQLSKLIERAEHGETITIARSGRPVAKLTGLDPSAGTKRRLGFLAGQIQVPDDFDDLGRETIHNAFGID
ncbi:type II toxin-antitoxin system Phd/YefM family antitoxin [Microlunatus speluncae]|uniref:type II toxin-antitoxin system Phd/YefM family antitoxin n=1 Tax=Microlunatus speluncae TaxID=2594267 RepID=UPI0012667A4C|nr:type II toxin-antitoxin system Phd/YefM family antitoxin [Microlunatus speluncae]